jgi:hypothetical protein
VGVPSSLPWPTGLTNHIHTICNRQNATRLQQGPFAPGRFAVVLLRRASDNLFQGVASKATFFCMPRLPSRGVFLDSAFNSAWKPFFLCVSMFPWSSWGGTPPSPSLFNAQPKSGSTEFGAGSARCSEDIRHSAGWPRHTAGCPEGCQHPGPR